MVVVMDAVYLSGRWTRCPVRRTNPSGTKSGSSIRWRAAGGDGGSVGGVAGVLAGVWAWVSSTLWSGCGCGFGLLVGGEGIMGRAGEEVLVVEVVGVGGLGGGEGVERGGQCGGDWMEVDGWGEGCGGGSVAGRGGWVMGEG